MILRSTLWLLLSFGPIVSSNVGGAHDIFKALLDPTIMYQTKLGSVSKPAAAYDPHFLGDNSFVYHGSLVFSVSSDSGCTKPYQTEYITTDTCLSDGSVSFKFQLATADTCAGAFVQYFYDSSCTVYAGSSEIKSENLGCRSSASNADIFTSISCSSYFPDASHFTQDEGSEAPSTEPTAQPIDYWKTPVELSVKQSIIGLTMDDYLADAEAHDAVFRLAIAETMDGVSTGDIRIDDVSEGAPMLGGLGRFLIFPEAFNFMPDATIRITYTVQAESFYTASELFSQLGAAQDMGLLNTRLAENAAARGVSTLLTAVTDAPQFVPAGAPLEEVAVRDWLRGMLVLKTLLCFVVMVLVASYLAAGGVRRGPPHSHMHHKLGADPSHCRGDVCIV